MSRTVRTKCDMYLGTTRDKKPWFKPPSWWKKMRSRMRRAKVRQALRTGRLLPIFKKSNVWDWN